MLRRVAALAKDVPENDRPAAGGKILDTDFFEALVDLGVRRDGLAQAGQVAFYIRQEYRHSNAREPFRQNLQRDGLTGTGRTGYQAVAVAK